MNDYELPEMTKWEIFSFSELQEIAADDEVTVENSVELIEYLESRRDNFVEVIGNGQYKVCFA